MLAPKVRKYASVADKLSIVQGLLLRGTRIVFPPSLREEVLQQLHTGHQGVVRCRARARESSWGPAVSQDVETHVSRCPTCTMHRPVTSEQLLQTPLPERPWQVVGTDLFHHEGRNYIVAVDYYSRFFELEELSGTQTKHVVQFLSNLFARYGIPDILRSDNGPQYSSLEFLQFTSSWGVRHVTSSPHYAQSNGEAERAVQTAKNIIRKSTNVAEGLLAHRAAPGPEGYSPAELLMGRELKTNVPTLPGTLEPKWYYQHQFRQNNAVVREREAKNYNRRRKTRDRPPLNTGTTFVQIRHGSQQQGTIVGESNAPRYVVQEAFVARKHICKRCQKLHHRIKQERIVQEKPTTPPAVAEPLNHRHA
ncbi:uncharacterized protein K02A2.6-like [Rhipicephalus sanguineus]|uniref:uncharacterized protein K02A2.6-like n=1 Tax=Rhipicephalus sanguineus TaxID=34632 RepID=UPI001895629D|nr:uncharacterized protein K02A2.6-like [Rhipicephalus sanguineus]